MAPSKYLMRVLSQPIKTDEKKWEKWYLNEHLPHVVDAGVAHRGALFRAHNDFALTTKTPPQSGETKLHGVQLSHFDEQPTDKTFCATYQTDFEDYSQTEEIKNVPQTGETFGGEAFQPLAEWDVRVYELIQNYDPDNLGESETPYCLHVQNEPSDDEDYHKFYEEEHLDLLHKVPGYRRSQRYKLARTLQGPEGVPRFMVVHEFEYLDALDGPELRHADSSPWVHKVFGNAKSVNVRGFRCVSSLGYKK
ncbi:hypothetical protein LTR37_003131 [Vermiconidia calcicola]|uniref:Uncharacterized protein n=1 Tax=Vermiconidia calcicola TaxID=1690605 RepID=A0ACC3NS09_9PEZI|nr:hypothetical protein LTR37_003131 [Vermiconidia calcicola]